MDIFRLPIDLIDFNHAPESRWHIRRFFIGFMLFLYYSYAFMFFFMVIFPSHAPINIDIQPPPAQMQPAEPDKNRADTELTTEQIPQKKQKTAHPLILMVTFGFIGGVFFITRTFVRTTQKLKKNGHERFDMAVAWYLTRPLQSALMAVFIYYAFRAGQLVFYSMEGAPSEQQINVYTLSLLAIVAGAFTEQAFEKLHAIATGLFKTDNPK